jgi:large subunit ribosomal protein L22
VRLVADLIRGKNVSQALTLLRVTPKRATLQLEKTLRSAIANAQGKGVTNPDALVISEIRVDKGVALHRFLPRAQGRATRIDKHSSNITLILAEAKKSESQKTKSEEPKKSKATKAEAKKETVTEKKLSAAQKRSAPKSNPTTNF